MLRKTEKQWEEFFESDDFDIDAFANRETSPKKQSSGNHRVSQTKRKLLDALFRDRDSTDEI